MDKGISFWKSHTRNFCSIAIQHRTSMKKYFIALSFILITCAASAQNNKTMKWLNEPKKWEGRRPETDHDG
jgi:DMSO/TMAO reductase YedYZ heme-binding membrane subunit